MEDTAKSEPASSAEANGADPSSLLNRTTLTVEGPSFGSVRCSKLTWLTTTRIRAVARVVPRSAGFAMCNRHLNKQLPARSGRGTDPRCVYVENS